MAMAYVYSPCICTALTVIRGILLTFIAAVCLLAIILDPKVNYVSKEYIIKSNDEDIIADHHFDHSHPPATKGKQCTAVMTVEGKIVGYVSTVDHDENSGDKEATVSEDSLGEGSNWGYREAGRGDGRVVRVIRPLIGFRSQKIILDEETLPKSIQFGDNLFREAYMEI